MVSRSHLWFWAVAMIMLSSCDSFNGKKSNSDTAHEQAEQVRLDVPESRISLPLHIPLTELQKAINRKLPGTFASDQPLKAGLTAHIHRAGDVQLSGSGETMHWSIPLEVQIMRAKGSKEVVSFSIRPKFTSVISLDADYTLRAKTEMDEMVWLEDAQIKLLGLQVDVTNLIERQLEKKSPEFTDHIDRELGNIQLKEQLKRTWTRLNNPIRINRKLQPLYVLAHPSELLLHSYRLDPEAQSLVINLSAMARLETVFDSAANVTEEPDYPPLRWVRERQETELFLPLTIEYTRMNQLLDQSLVGKQFTVEGQHIHVDSLHVDNHDGELLRITALFSGDWDAEMDVTGRPFFDETAKKVGVRGFDFEVKEESSSLFHATDYLFHDEINERVLSYLDIPVGHFIDSLPQVIYYAVERGRSGSNIDLRSKVEHIAIDQFVVGENALGLVLHARGAITVDIEHIPDRRKQML